MKASEKWQNHIENQEQSGLTQAEYCRQHNLHPVSFSQWKRRLRVNNQTNSFIALDLPAFQTDHSDNFRLCLADNMELVFPAAINNDRLVEIISSLRKA